LCEVGRRADPPIADPADRLPRSTDATPTSRIGSRTTSRSRAVAEAELALEKARRYAAALGVKIAEADAEAATAEREFRAKQRARIAELERRGSVDRLLVEEEERLRGAQAAERAARLGIEVARARLATAEAAVREAQAISDVSRIGSGATPAVDAENGLEDARAERSHARNRVEQAEAEAARARLDAAEDRLRSVESEAGGAGHGTGPPGTASGG
jgi:hypothetical protein